MNDEAIGGTGGGGDSLAGAEVSTERRGREVTVLSSPLSAKPNPTSSFGDEPHLALLYRNASVSSSNPSSDSRFQAYGGAIGDLLTLRLR